MHIATQAVHKWVLHNFLRKKIYSANYTGMAEQGQCCISKNAQSSTGNCANLSEFCNTMFNFRNHSRDVAAQPPEQRPRFHPLALPS